MEGDSDNKYNPLDSEDFLETDYELSDDDRSIENSADDVHSEYCEEGPVEGDDYITTYDDIQDNFIMGFYEHKGPVYSVHIHPNKPNVLCGSGDDRASVWDINMGKSIYSKFSSEFGESVTAVRFSHDGIYASAGALNGLVKIWNSDTGEVLHELDTSSGINWIRWHSSLHQLIVGCEDGSVWMWKIPDLMCNVVEIDGSSVNTGGFSHHGHIAVFGTNSGTLGIFDTCGLSPVNRYQDEKNKVPIHSMCISLDSNCVLAGREDSLVDIFSTNGDKKLGSFTSGSGSVESIDISGSYPNISISGGLDGYLNIWDISHMRSRGNCVHPEGITKVMFIEDTNTFITASVQGILRLWDMRTSKIEGTFYGHRDKILDFDCRDDFIITGSDDGSSLVFSVKR